MHVVDMDLAVPDRCERIPDIHPGVPNRLDLRAGEHHARFVGIFDEIIMGSFFVLRQHLTVTLLTHVLTLL
ncbi:hypothetical protein D3C74_468960 [compost metagenome]